MTDSAPGASARGDVEGAQRRGKQRVRASLSLWKKLCFALIVVVGPLLGLEACLRLFAPQTTWTENPVHTPWTEWGLVPNQSLRTYGPEFGEMICQTNSDAIRDQIERPVEVPPGVTRILLLGDSFVEGWGCPYGQTFGCRLESALNERLGEGRVDVIKAGVRGFGTDDAVNAFRCKWSAYRPDVVVIGVLLNDVLENPTVSEGSNVEQEVAHSGSEKVADRRLESDFGPMNEVTQRIHLMAATRRLLMMSDSLYLKLFFLNRPDRRVLEDPLSIEAETLYANTLDHVRVLQTGCEAIGAELHVLLIPQGVQVRLLAAPVDGVDSREFSRRLGDGLTSLGVPHLDTLDALAEVPVETSFFLSDGHLTPAGHEIVADELLAYLLARSNRVARLPSE